MSATTTTADHHDDDHGGDHGHGHGGADHVPHVLPMKNYFGVWGALMVLTAITVGASYVDFGSANLVIALLVATTKAILVGAIFMHLKYDARFNVLVFVCSVVFLGIFIGFTSLDLNHRGAADPKRAERPADSTDPFGPAKPKPKVVPKAHGEGHGEHH